MEDILLTEKDLLNIITSIHAVKTMAGLSEQDRKEYDELLNKIKILYASSVLSENSSLFENAMGGEDSSHGLEDFEDEEYIFESVPAQITETFLFDDGDKNKKVDVLFSLIKGSSKHFIAIVDLEEESLETNVESFKLIGNVVHVFDKTTDKESMFEVELKEKELKN